MTGDLSNYCRSLFYLLKNYIFPIIIYYFFFSKYANKLRDLMDESLNNRKNLPDTSNKLLKKSSTDIQIIRVYL